MDTEDMSNEDDDTAMTEGSLPTLERLTKRLWIIFRPWMYISCSKYLMMMSVVAHTMTAAPPRPLSSPL